MDIRRSYYGVLQLTVAASLLLTMVSCSKSVSGDFADDETMGAGVADSRLEVVTRDGESGDIAYPVRVFVFNDDGECVNVQSIQEGSDVFSMELPAGRYDVLAVGDADDERYELPTMSTATTDFEIRTKDGKLVDDMMTANSSVTLQRGVTSQLTLNMERKVMQMVSATIRALPTTVTAVSLSIGPLYEYVLLDGTLGGEDGSYTLSLSRQSDGETWKATPANAYMYPSYGKPTFTVTITTPSGTNAYMYTCNEALPANYRLQVVGTYTNNAVQLSGVINGINWAGMKTITFDFDETSSSGSVTTEENGDDNGGNNGGGGQVVNGEVPAVGTLYQGCYVIAATENTATIVSSVSLNEVVTGSDIPTCLVEINETLDEWSVSGIEAAWRLPNRNEAQLIYNARSSITNVSSEIGRGYFYMDSESDCGTFRHDDQNGLVFLNNMGKYVFLRPVTTLTFE